MPLDGDTLLVKILAKEYRRPEDGTRLYLVQAVKVETSGSVEGGQTSDSRPGRSSSSPPDVSGTSVAETNATVKETPDRLTEDQGTRELLEFTRDLEDLRHPGRVREDDKPEYERRPDTDESKSDELARGAVNDVRAAAESAVSARADARGLAHLRSPAAVPLPRLHALGITPELVRTQRLDLRDRVITGAHDLASLVQGVRDPRIETLRVVYTTRLRLEGLQAHVVIDSGEYVIITPADKLANTASATRRLPAHEVRWGKLALEHRVLEPVAEATHRLVDPTEAEVVRDVVADEIGVAHGCEATYRRQASAAVCGGVPVSD